MTREKHQNKKKTPKADVAQRSQKEIILEHIRKGKLYFGAEQYKEAKETYQQANRLLNHIITGKTPDLSFSKAELLLSSSHCNYHLGKIFEYFSGFANAQVAGFYNATIASYEKLIVEEGGNSDNLLTFEAISADVSNKYIALNNAANLADAKKKNYVALGIHFRLKIVEVLNSALPMHKTSPEYVQIYLKLLIAHDHLMTLYYDHNDIPKAIEYCTSLIKLKLEGSIVGEANFVKTSPHFSHYRLAEDFRVLAELQSSNKQDFSIIIENLEHAIEHFGHAHKKGEELTKEHYDKLIGVIEKTRLHYSDNRNLDKISKYVFIQQSYQQFYEQRWPLLEPRNLQLWGVNYGLLALIEQDDERKILHYQKAIGYIEKLLEHDLDTAQAKGTADYLIKNLYLSLINIYIKQHKLELAEDLYEKAIYLGRNHSIDGITPLLSEISPSMARFLLSGSPKPTTPSATSPITLSKPAVPPTTSSNRLFELTESSANNNFWTTAVISTISSLALILVGLLVVVRKRRQKKRISKHSTLKRPTVTTASTATDSEEVTDNISEAEIPTPASPITSPNMSPSTANTTKADTIIRRVPKGKNQDPQKEEENKKKYRELNNNLDALFSECNSLKRALIEDVSNLANNMVFSAIESQYTAGYPAELTTQTLKIENDKLNNWRKELKEVKEKHDDSLAKKRISNNGNKHEAIGSDERKATPRSAPKTSSYSSQAISMVDEKKLTSSTGENLGSQYGLDNPWLVKELEHLKNEVVPIATKSECSYEDMKIMRYMLAGILIRLLHKVALCKTVFPSATTEQANTIRDNLSHNFHEICTPISEETFSSEIETIKNENALLYNHTLELIYYLNKVNQDLSCVIKNSDLAVQLGLNLDRYLKPPLRTKGTPLVLADRYYQDWLTLGSNCDDPNDPMRLVAIGFLCAVGGAQVADLEPNQRGKLAKMLEPGREFRHAPDYRYYEQLGRDSITLLRKRRELPKAPKGGLFKSELKENKRKASRLPASSTTTPTSAQTASSNF